MGVTTTTTTTEPTAAAITEDWLRATGFKWEQHDRQPSRHWFLWIGQSIPDPSGGWKNSADDLGIEVARGQPDSTWWYFWIRSDLAGRYSRFIHIRHVETVEQLTRWVEAVTDRPWDPANVRYGQYWTPEAAERLRRDSERLDWRLAKEAAERSGEDLTKSRRLP